MLFHMLLHSFNVLKIMNMTELVHLVKTDSLDGHNIFNEIQISLGCCNSRNTGAGEGYLGG